MITWEMFLPSYNSGRFRPLHRSMVGSVRLLEMENQKTCLLFKELFLKKVFKFFFNKLKIV